MPRMMKRSLWGSLIALAVVLTVGLSSANFFLGNLNQDEGWYLYAAKQVAEGKILYRDFMFTQGPMLPLVYGVLFPIVEKLGVAGGRLITTLLGWGAVGLSAWLAARSAKRFKGVTALCAFILVGMNVYQGYFMTIVKTYSLCAFFLMAGFVALSYANGKRGASAAFWGGFLLALAACTRLSAGIVLPIAGFWLIWNRRRVYPFGGGKTENGGERREAKGWRSHFKFLISKLKFIPAWVAFGLGGGLVLAGILGSFFWIAPKNTCFGLLGYHAGRCPGGIMEWLALKAGFISRFVQAYFMFTAGCVLAFLFHHHCRIRENDGMDLSPQTYARKPPFLQGFISLLWMAGIAITLLHFIAPFPYDDYQVMVYPLLATALTAMMISRCPEKQLLRIALAVLLVSTAASFSSPMNQNWLIRGRDRIWWKFKETPDLMVLQRTAVDLRKRMGEEKLLLTQDTYLAIEARAYVPHGLEMGPFSYYPELSRAQAKALNLVNKEMLIELLLKADAPIAAFSGYGLSIVSPEVTELSITDRTELRKILEMNYTKRDEIKYFGQAHTVLEIFENRHPRTSEGL